MTNLYLSHHGIKGMKWGIRRYQNYDGSYTQKGLQRYRKSESDYYSAKERYRKSKSLGDSQGKKLAKADMKKAKRDMNKHYKGLKQDKMADQGKALYKSGKTISDNLANATKRQVAIAVGGNVVGMLLTNSNVPYGTIAASTLTAGASFVNLALATKSGYENKRLRAYYAH